MTTQIMARQRAALIARWLPGGLPPLWCPTLTHYEQPGRLDVRRIRAHMRALTSYVGGVLVPSSTGEGWEMSDDEVEQLLPVVLESARAAEMRVLLGVLKTTTADTLAMMDRLLSWLKRRAGVDDPQEAMRRAGVVGWTVCPPKGKQFTQDLLVADLSKVLARGLPIALYQLPQVTENELAPAAVERLAALFPNFLYFKDTSGKDRVALSGRRLGGVVLLRGAEGNYTEWPRIAGGPYDGFLLSTANVFPRQLREVLRLLDRGEKAEAEALAGRVQAVVEDCFRTVADFPAGNPFTNANKLLDQVMAFGPAAANQQPPLLHGGQRLPREFVLAAIELLKEQQLLPERGYFAAGK